MLHPHSHPSKELLARLEHAPLLAIVDADSGSRAWLRATLESAGYRAEAHASFADFRPRFPACAAEAVLLDLAEPELARLDAIDELRRASELPIVIVSSSAAERDKISALDAGADDYLLKPLSVGEFLARVRVALRHGRARRVSQGGRIRLDALSIDLLTREVTLAGVRLSLTPTDYKLLALLARNLERVVPHEQLLQAAWGPNARDPHYLRVYMARLRRKLDPERLGTRYIVTEAGIGYRLVGARSVRDP